MEELNPSNKYWSIAIAILGIIMAILLAVTEIFSITKFWSTVILTVPMLVFLVIFYKKNY